MKNFTLIILSSLLFSAAQSQVLDADFSSWENDLPNGWYGTKSNIFEENVIQADNNGGQGNYAVELVNSESSHKRFTTQPIMVEAGVNYAITFWARGNGDLRTGLFDDRENANGYVYSAYVNLASDTWTEFTQNIVAAENNNDAEFILSVRNTAGDLNVQIDRVLIETSEIDVVSIYDIQYTEQPDGSSPLEGDIVTTTGIVTAVGAGGYFLQDGGGAWNGLFVYSFDEPSIGDEVIVTGLVEEFNNMTELTGTTGYTVLSSGNSIEVTDINTQQVNTEPYESVLARVQNANCIDPSAPFGFFIVDDGSGACFVSPVIYDYDATFNENYNITGMVFYSFDEWKIMPRFAADVEISTSISEITSEDGILIFPNPAKDVLNLEWQNAQGGVVEYQLFSISGRLVKSGALQQPFSSINLSGLAPGWYSLNLIDDAEIKHARIVVER